MYSVIFSWRDLNVGMLLQLVRDLCSWCGLRQVSRRTFVRALQDKGSVMLVPGGQAELVHTWRIKCNKEYVVYGRHKGECNAVAVAWDALQFMAFESHYAHPATKGLLRFTSTLS